MRKGKTTMIITIGIACFALATVMTMQFKIVNETDITSIETMRKAELETELGNWKSIYEETEAKYQETQEKIEEYKQKEQSNIETEELVKEELNQVNTSLGLTDVVGPGIVVTLEDSESEAIRDIEADDILVIVNALKLAGAEAISVNGKRIINMSDIVYISGSSFIRVNQERILSPYVIKAIGNESYLESSLVGNGGQVDILDKLGHKVSIEKQKDIKIDKYNNEIKVKYIE